MSDRPAWSGIPRSVLTDARARIDALRRTLLSIDERDGVETLATLRDQLLAQVEGLAALVEAIGLSEPGSTGSAPSVSLIDSNPIAAEKSAHWARLYEDLAALERDALERRRAQGDGIQAASAEDAELLEASVGQLEERFRHWRKREWALRGITCDDEERTLRHHASEVKLTGREYALVTTLMESRDRWVSARRLVSVAWGDSSLTAEQLRTYVVRLRRRLAGSEIPLSIVNRRGQGYRLEVESN